MTLVRYEQDVITQDRREIEQILYEDDAGAIIAIDSGGDEPEGYTKVEREKE